MEFIFLDHFAEGFHSHSLSGSEIVVGANSVFVSGVLIDPFLF